MFDDDDENIVLSSTHIEGLGETPALLYAKSIETLVEEPEAMGTITETRSMLLPLLGTVCCRRRKTSNDKTTPTIELSKEALESLGFTFSFSKTRGSLNLEIKRIDYET